MNPKKHVIVSGGSRGLGLHVTRILLEKGYRVSVVSRVETDEIGFLGKDFKDSLFHYTFDFQNTGGIKNLVKKIVDERDGLFGLVNNAAIGKDGLLATMHESDIARVLKINLEAPILMTKYCSRWMLSSREGVIVNISSIVASSGFNGLSVYGATKGALNSFTRSMSRELGKLGIRVVCVAPGYMDTDMTEGVSHEKLETIVNRSPMKRLASPEDVAKVVVSMIGDDFKSLVGTVVTVDVGATA